MARFAGSRKLVAIAPGWGSFDLSWIRLQNLFQELDYDIVVFNYDDRGLGSISNNAIKVAKALDEMRNDYDHIIFIGHSMGGLIGRYIVQGLQRHDLFNIFISIATPHRGTHLARISNLRFLENYKDIVSKKTFQLFETSSAYQMLPESNFLKSINILDWPDEIMRLSFGAGYDWILMNNRTCEFGTHTLIRKATHTSIINSQELLNAMNSLIVAEKLHENIEVLRKNSKNFLKSLNLCKIVKKTMKNVHLWIRNPEIVHIPTELN